MLRLYTFGTTFIADEKGQPIGGAATHRRTLALLALLASAGSGGLSRDKLISILWPESDEARARHSLTQALYAARRALETDDLFLLTGPDIRLNPERLSSDVQDFERLIACGDGEGALALYRGPFLDAVFLADAGDFERWSTGERERIQRSVGDILASLADDAERTGRLGDAVAWRRQLAGMSPLDSRKALDYMRALAAVGDAAGALRHAQVHATLLRHELDIEPHPDVIALSEQIRAGVARVTGVVERPARESPALSMPAERPHQLAPTVPPPRLASQSQTRVRWRAPAIGAVATFATIAIVALLWQDVRPAPAASSVSAPRIVVAPFRVRGAAPSMSYLREGIVELLSGRLANDTASRSVDAGAVLRASRAAGLAPSDDIGDSAATSLARRLGAERVVVGSVVGTLAHIVVSATILRASDARVTGQATVSGPADSLVSLLDRLAARLLVSEAGQEKTLSHYTTRSLPALKSFLSGQAAYRREDFPAALAFYHRAIRADSTFALAALYAATTADALHLTGAFQNAVAIAWSSRGDLAGRDRALLDALAGPRYPAPSPGPELAAAWQHFVDLAPQSGEAWFLVAVRMLEDGAAAGIPDARARAIAALQRAVALRGADPRAAVMLRDLTGGAGSLEHTPRRAVPYTRLSSAELRARSLAALFDGAPLGDARRALEVLRARGGTSLERADIALAEHSLAMSEGRQADVTAANERLRRALPESDAWLRLRVLDVVHGGGEPALAASAIRALSRWEPGTPLARPVSSAGALANACVVAQWRLSHHDSTGVARTIDVLRQSPTIRPPFASAAPLACAVLLDAWLPVSMQGSDARARLSRLDSLAFTPQVAGDVATYAHLVIARLYLALGDSASARRAIRRAPYMSGWPRYARASRTLDSLLTVRDSTR